MANQQSAPAGVLSPSGGLYLGSDMVDPGAGEKIVLLDTVLGGFNDGIEDTANNRIVFTKAGLYLCIAQVFLSKPAADQKNSIYIVHNNMTYFGTGIYHSSINEYQTLHVAHKWPMAVNDYIKLHVSLGDATIDVLAGDNWTFLVAQWLRST